jgi:cytidylate kinase
MQIAIDGPVAAGKTSLGRALADHFGCLFVETGKMYRAVALGLSRGQTLETLDITIDHSGIIRLNGEDITDVLYTSTLDEAASRVATQMPVREKLVRLQREIAASRDVVMEGRDIGTVVLPNADVKVYLNASPEERARRRAEERSTSEYEKILDEIRRRDERDRNRKLSPLNPACDAIIIDSDQKTLAEVISEAVELVKERLKSH